MKKADKDMAPPENGPGASPTILVVEDDVDSLFLVRRILERAGYKTEGAATGAAALVLAVHEPVKLMLLDYHLADMTGTQVVEILAERRPGLPFIIMTGFGNEMLAVEMMKLGALDYVVKDSDFLEFLPKVVDRVMEQMAGREKLTAMEKDLHESEEWFQVLTKTATDAILCMDGQGKISFWNQAATRILGYTEQEAMGASLHDLLVPAEYKERARNGLLNFFRTGTGPVIGKTLEFTALRKDGVKIPVELSISSVKRDGSWHATGIIRDITERKRFVEELRRSERNLAEAQRIAHLGSWELDLTKDELKWSDEVFRIFGLEPQQFDATYEAFLDAVHPDDREIVDSAYTSSVKSGAPYEVVHGIIRKSDGQARYVHERCEHIKDEDGKIIRSVGTVQDITEQRRAESRAKESLKAFSGFLNMMESASMDEIIQFGLDEAVRMSQSKTGFFHLLNPDRKAVGPRSWSTETPKQCPREERDARYAIDKVGVWMDCVDQKRPVIRNNYEALPQNKGLSEGHVPLVREMAVPVLDGDKVVAVLGVGNKEEDYVQYSVDNLSLIAESMWRIIQRKQINEKLKELDRLKSMFIASMSHELRTPLNSIIGFTGILLMGLAGELNGEQRKQLSMVKGSANHLLELINEIIDVSKIESGKAQPEIREYDLGALVREVAGSLEVAAKGKGIKLSIEAPESLPLKGDKKRVKQALVNLMGNAVKFTDEGGVFVQVAERKGAVEISVRDTGQGIREEDMEKLFTPFGQLPVKGVFVEGTGLGLYISKKIADLLGGDIRVESEPGKGSVFVFSLPKTLEGVKNEKNTGGRG